MYSHLYQINIFIVYHTIFLLYIYILKLIYFLYIQLDKFQLILITFFNALWYNKKHWISMPLSIHRHLWRINMTRKEINEIKSQFNIEDCGILKLCGCYVDGEKNKVTTINETFLNLPEEERHKYIDIFKKMSFWHTRT